MNSCRLYRCGEVICAGPGAEASDFALASSYATWTLQRWYFLSRTKTKRPCRIKRLGPHLVFDPHRDLPAVSRDKSPFDDH